MPAGNKLLTRLCESFKNASPSFLQGIIILSAPFIIIILAVLASQQKHIDLERIMAEKINQHTINAANSKNSKRVIVSQQFQQFLDKHQPGICKAFSSANNSQINHIKKTIREELEFYGLPPKHVIHICNDSCIPASCGIHAGNVISGLMGNEKRRDHTIIGDTVNVAACCFSVSDQIAEKSAVICTDAAFSKLSASFTATNLGTFVIKGKKEPLNLFRLGQ